MIDWTKRGAQRARKYMRKQAESFKPGGRQFPSMSDLDAAANSPDERPQDGQYGLDGKPITPPTPGAGRAAGNLANKPKQQYGLDGKPITPPTAGAGAAAGQAKAIAQSKAMMPSRTAPVSGLPKTRRGAFDPANQPQTAQPAQSSSGGQYSSWDQVPEDFRNKFNSNMQSRQASGKGQIWSQENALKYYNQHYAGNDSAQQAMRKKWGQPAGESGVYAGAGGGAGAKGVAAWTPPNAASFQQPAQTAQQSQPQNAVWKNPQFQTNGQMDYGKMMSHIGQMSGGAGMQSTAQPALDAVRQQQLGGASGMQSSAMGALAGNSSGSLSSLGGQSNPAQMQSTAQPAIAAASAPKPAAQQQPAYSYNAQFGGAQQGKGAIPMQSTAQPAIAAATAPKPAAPAAPKAPTATASLGGKPFSGGKTGASDQYIDSLRAKTIASQSAAAGLRNALLPY